MQLKISVIPPPIIVHHSVYSICLYPVRVRRFFISLINIPVVNHEQGMHACVKHSKMCINRLKWEAASKLRSAYPTRSHVWYRYSTFFTLFGGETFSQVGKPYCPLGDSSSNLAEGTSSSLSLLLLFDNLPRNGPPSEKYNHLRSNPLSSTFVLFPYDCSRCAS